MDTIIPLLLFKEQPLSQEKCCVCKRVKDVSLFHQFIAWRQARWIVCKNCASAGKHCSRCEIYQTFDKFPKGKGTNRGGVRGYCKPCMRKYNRERYKANGKTENQIANEALQRDKQYNLTPGQRQAMHDAQGGVCAVCGNPDRRISKHSGKVYELHLDHNHETGQVRELLCHQCNVALGNLKDDPERIRKLLAYAEKWKV